MTPKDYIYRKQIAWAKRQADVSLNFCGQSRNCGYVTELKQNLFPKDRVNSIAEDFKQADGNELGGKMLAVHSSSALAVNLFDFWRDSTEKMFSLAMIVLAVPPRFTGKRSMNSKQLREAMMSCFMRKRIKNCCSICTKSTTIRTMTIDSISIT